MPKAPKISIERVKEVLDYNPETGAFTWKKNVSKNIKAGQEAGPKPTKNGYRFITIDGVQLTAQRVAWVIVNGEFPDHHVAFKDGNKSNLKFDNLIAKIIMHKAQFDMRTKEGVSEYGKYWRKKHPDKWKDRKLKSSFKISLSEFTKMLEKQNGLCAICDCCETTTRNGRVVSLSVDHDHETGELRQLLCSKCNTAIGLLKDNPDLCIKASQYLGFHRNRKSGTVIPLKIKGIE